MIAVAGLLVIAACNQLAPRVGVASPLLLLVLGIGIGFLPFVTAIELNPEIVLEAVLPPLLYSTAVSMPVADFRRELRSVSALAVGLVAVSAVVIGLVAHMLVPAIPLPWAIALGAVLSPTDAVAIAIVRGLGVTDRIITILEGEGLFNDATALILLSSAVSAGVARSTDSLEPGALAAQFLTSLALALFIGWAVGTLAVRVRARISESTADTVVSFTVPFLASLPAEYLGGSGLVAAVVAGLITSYRGPWLLSPVHRVNARHNWRTIELILEGGVFLFMGLQAYGIVQEVAEVGYGARTAVILAVSAWVLTVLVRLVFVAPMLVWLGWVRRRRSRRLEYFTSEPLGPREGAVIIWAGMRGAVTLAAAQTLPLSTPARPLLLLVALLVSGGSLIVQGLTLDPLIRLMRPRMAQDDDAQTTTVDLAVTPG